MVYSRFLITLIMLLGGFKSWSQSAQLTTIGKEDTLISNVLGEKRSVVVSLPASYQSDDFYQQKRYPVCILLDADTHFQYASSMIHFLSAGENEQIPEMIVVAVRNTDRTRDMVGGLKKGTDNFRLFLENELVPYIDQHYRTVPYRLLVGHSLAGLFTVNSLLDQRLFNAYVAIDPTLTWNNGYIVTKSDSIFAKNTMFHTRLYISQSDNPFATGQHIGARGKAFDAFAKSLANNGSKGFFHRFRYFKNETHFSVPFQSLYNGLQFVFEGYTFPYQTFLVKGSKGISQHYQQLFSQWKADLLPPGKVINQVGLFLLTDQKQIDKSLDLLRLNERYYPDSPVVYRSLGEAYWLKGEKNRAVQAYKKALALKATDEKSIQAIQALTNP